jgi:type I restriction enzyme M protein
MPKPRPPAEPFADDGRAIHTDGNWAWVPLRSKWVDVTHKPEELVRQEWVRRLVVEGGFELSQMDQERHDLVHGTGSPRADVVVWSSAADKAANASAIMVVETKAGDGEVIISDFRQGESYARAGGSEFLIAATATHHASFQLKAGFPGRADQINDWPRKNDFADGRRLAALKKRLRTFDREEFQKLLYECHSLLRDHHAMTPERAFDTISKVLFMKLDIERTGRWGTFTTDYLDERQRLSRRGEVPIHQILFEETKENFEKDDLFGDSDQLELSAATFRELVSKLQRFNLSQTGEDIKGIAFEKFLSRTSRGDLGQFFTPRPVVDFIIEVLAPREGELICDPAAGSGGFLIRAFEYVRSIIAEDIERQKDARFAEIEAAFSGDLTDEQIEERNRQIDAAFNELNADLMPTLPDGTRADSRVARLAWDCIYGCDKEPRAARTAKMNMVMHGDGHGGIHWHDGLVNINGIFEERFDIVVTNPPFGATVSKTQLVGATAESNVPEDRTYTRRHLERYGEPWRASQQRVINARQQPILDLFELGRGKKSLQTPSLFLERCLQLLKPGGRLGIVLPNGNLNGANLAWVRRWVEGQARILGVVNLPLETFRFSGASVSASVMFLRKFDSEDRTRWEAAWSAAEAELHPAFDERRQALVEAMAPGVWSGLGDPVLVEAVEKLGELGVSRTVEWQRVPPDLPERGAGVTKVPAPKWSGRPNDQAGGRSWKAVYAERAAELSEEMSVALAELRAALRAIDEEHTAALWSNVRTAFDYPVFVSAPGAVGITASGDTGESVPNELPEVLAAWRTYEEWVLAGAPEDEMPCLP